MAKKRSNTTRFLLNPDHPPELTPAQAKRLDDTPIDYTDIPELPDDFWTTHRPVTREGKEQITVRFDKSVVGFFRAQGSRYQTRMNDVLRTYVDVERQREAAHGTEPGRSQGATPPHVGRKSDKPNRPTGQKGQTQRRTPPHEKS